MGVGEGIETVYGVGYRWNRAVPTLLIETEAQADAWSAAGGVTPC